MLEQAEVKVVQSLSAHVYIYVHWGYKTCILTVYKLPSIKKLSLLTVFSSLCLQQYY